MNLIAHTFPTADVAADLVHYTKAEAEAVRSFCEKEITRRRNLTPSDTYAAQQFCHGLADALYCAMGILEGRDEHDALYQIQVELDDVDLWRCTEGAGA